MKLALAFALQAALFGFLGAVQTHDLVRVALLYCAASFLLLGIVHLLDVPRLFFKRADGRIAPQGYLLFAPWIFLARTIGAGLRAGTGEDAFHEVHPGLLLGRRLSARESRSDDLPELAGVLDLTCELTEVAAFRGEGYLCVPTLDTFAPTLEGLSQGVAHIEQTLQRGVCYVHCAMGHGRGATFVAAYLLCVGTFDTLDEAARHLKSIRPGVSIKRRQRNAIASWLEQRSSPAPDGATPPGHCAPSALRWEDREPG